MPPDMPVTTPVVEPIVAIAVALLLQVPPAVASNKGVVAPTHIVVVPLIALGPGLTVTMIVAEQVPKVYDIIAVPNDTPVTIPVAGSIDATVGSLLPQIPPADVSLRVVVKPMHSTVLPVIGPGTGLTAIVKVV